MPYDRKPAYGPKKTPPRQSAPEPAKEPSAEELERERQHEALAARGRAYGEANPRLTDLENYPTEAFAGPGRRLPWMSSVSLPCPSMMLRTSMVERPVSVAKVPSGLRLMDPKLMPPG